MPYCPSKDEIIKWVNENPTLSKRKDIANAFRLRGSIRIELKNILRELEKDGTLLKANKVYRSPNTTDRILILKVMAPTSDGEIFARPVHWDEAIEEPIVYIKHDKNTGDLSFGDRILTQITSVDTNNFDYVGKVIKKIDRSSSKHLGIFRNTQNGPRVRSVDKSRRDWLVELDEGVVVKDGELVEVEKITSEKRIRSEKVRISERLGDPSAPRSISLIAIHQHKISNTFPDEVLLESQKSTLIENKKWDDYTGIPFVTIDPGDARDHDDACYAKPDEDLANPGGHLIWVAIADVAHFVRSGSPTDNEARLRGNSTYFPDRVVPMLPDRLSGDLCSLHEGENRACIVVKIQIDSAGKKLSHKFSRAIIQSGASLEYGEVQEAMDKGTGRAKVLNLLDTVLKPLYSAYYSLKISRETRGPLELNLPERQIKIDEKGIVTEVRFKERLEAHKLIEEFMILANVCAAETLSENKIPTVFRVHEEPEKEKIEVLRKTARSAGLNLRKGQNIKAIHINELLAQAESVPFRDLINLSTLRSMNQAYYSPENFGHFGLSLSKYAHFTSPIRRYSDLIVHRALIFALGLGDDGLKNTDIDNISHTAEKISECERRSMVAERDTNDRYLAQFLAEKIGSEFCGSISGVSNFGIFVRLDETGADGIVPVRTIAQEYFKYDKSENRLIGSKTGLMLELGMSVRVILKEVEPLAGGIVFQLTQLEDEPLTSVSRITQSKFTKKKNKKTKNKNAKHRVKTREKKV